MVAIAQENFNTEEYYNFLNDNQNMVFDALTDMHPLKNQYFKGIDNGKTLDDYHYFDSIALKYNLTLDEKDLITQNHFMVTERLSYPSFGKALYDVYEKDMPVFISTDIILHALHMSYDLILQNIERRAMLKNIDSLLINLYYGFPDFYANYENKSELTENFKDIDLYITIAYSLINNSLISPHIADTAKVNEVWNAINAKSYIEMPLFSKDSRMFDFSQFIVRGHYTDDEQVLAGYKASLEPYFRTMMWLGRIDFWLSNSAMEALQKEDISRMTIDAFLLNELLMKTGSNKYIDQNNEILNYLVGESDNLTHNEFSDVLQELSFYSASELLDTTNQNLLLEKLTSNEAYAQKILSSVILSNPYSSLPDKLPISYKLMGQRFIIDSYIFSNVVYDRITFEDKKIWRPMPDPLDAMFALGNENALPLLEDEIDTYKYALQLASMRYLIDNYDDAFWSKSFYNSWLDAIRNLVAPNDHTKYPIFSKTAAWQQQKLNTQLASWSQLRHDNLLYAKPSYTGGTTCKYPHSYVEPCPEFYSNLSNFTADASNYFSELSTSIPYISYISYYFNNFSKITDTLYKISLKELNGETFSNTEIDFLKNMLFMNEMCGPPMNGWYAGLFYSEEDPVKEDYIIADVHTQPTDEFGGTVGNVLHASTGKINLGVIMAKAPSFNNKPMAFVGPFYSYYEKHTSNFNRLTDEEWSAAVQNNEVPTRPDWVNIYLANGNGKRLIDGKEIPSIAYVGIKEHSEIENILSNFILFPNPVENEINLNFELENTNDITIEISDYQGRVIYSKTEPTSKLGKNSIVISSNNLTPGLYFCTLKVGDWSTSLKFIK